MSWFYELLSSSQSESTAVSSEIQREAPRVDEQNKRYETKASKARSISNPIGGDLASAMESGKSLQANWAIVLEGLSNEIKLRHYSPKALKCYSTWIFKLRHVTRSKDPQALTSSDCFTGSCRWRFEIAP